jgi:C4-dicarboxylate-specific signal transduction histidine kinase
VSLVWRDAVTRRLLVTYLTITALALTALAVPLGLSFSRRERDRLYVDIERDAIVIASLVEDSLEEGETPQVDAVLADYRERTSGRIIVVDRDGVSVADSDGPEATPRDYSTRPEIQAALDGRRAEGTRRSSTLDENLVYVSIPVASAGQVLGAVRITFPTAARSRSATWPPPSTGPPPASTSRLDPGPGERGLDAVVMLPLAP